MEKIDLNDNWKFREVGNHDFHNASVPGCVHLDLLANKIIPDPYYRDNETEIQWVSEKDWFYTNDFKIDTKFLDNEHIYLNCEGLDTFGEIEINGISIGTTDNMFRVWEFDVKKTLKEGLNTISIIFKSTLPYARKKDKEKHLIFKKTPIRPESGNWIRKQPSNYGWDWGPHLVTCGIWRPISITAWDSTRINDFMVRQHWKDKSVLIDLVVTTLEYTSSNRCTMSVLVMNSSGKILIQEDKPIKKNSSRFELLIKNPELWWPNGMGEQSLITISVTLKGPNGQELDSTSRRIGLRKMELICEKDNWGESFKFRCNGKDFFAKGANWIPADTFDKQASDDQIRDLLNSAAEANMNFIRVWGGGLYERDSFYDVCDEIGLCVWQDFMFAGGAYPAHDPEFLNSVREEAIYNVRRLRNHASLAIWCGNNEMEMNDNLVGNTDGAMSFDAYASLFDELIPNVLLEYDPDRPYWPSSPHSPIGNRFGKENSKDPRWGNAHLWEVWHGREPFEWYHKSYHRFCTEFGFQSFPEPATVLTYTEPSDRNITSWVMEKHQRSKSGNSVIMDYMLSWFRLPIGWENTVWLSQILQALAIQYAVEHWRRNMPRCMGSLYWQLNDCWPVASWASIDYKHRWKALHYSAKRFYAPIIVSGKVNHENKTAEIHVTNDGGENIQAELKVSISNTDGIHLRDLTNNIVLPYNGSEKVLDINLSSDLEKTNTSVLLIWVVLKVDGKTLARNLLHLARPKHLELREPHLDSTISVKNGNIKAEITTDKPALWVWIESPLANIRWDDNFFHLNAGETRILSGKIYHKDQKFDNNSIKIKNLIDTYKE